MFIGAGTTINVATVLVGSGIGALVGGRLPERTTALVTSVLGLFTLVIGGKSIAGGLSPALAAAVTANGGMLVVLGALLIGAIIGSGVRLEDRLNQAATWVGRRFFRASPAGVSDAVPGAGGHSSRFAEAAVTATLIFCVGPMSILGSISDGLGTGAQLLIIKAVMDGFAAIAFTASLGGGVALSVVPLALYQGTLTAIGWGAGSFLTAAQIDALGATGGVILLGLGVRMIGLKRLAVGDLLPALIIAPILVLVITWLR